jgi:formate C-acetyltransferase
MHKRDTEGALACLHSIARTPYDICTDGISNTFSLMPNALGENIEQ